jgi:SPP1 gp7 family putative phage head morphogenesis protein
MSIPQGSLADFVDTYRGGPEDLVGTAYAEVDLAYISLRARLRKQEKKLSAAIQAAGPNPKPSEVYQLQQTKELLRQVEETVLGFEEKSLGVVKQAERDALELGADAAFSATQYVLDQPGAPDPAVPGYPKLNKPAIQNLVAAYSSDSPLSTVTGSFLNAGISGQTFRKELTLGLATGKHPDEIVRGFTESLSDRERSRARTVVRTEIWRAYRGAQMAVYRENDDVIETWTWFAILRETTCPVCWASHGQKFLLEENLSSHPNCRCTTIPNTPSWEDLGFPGIPDERPQVPTGPEVFETLAPEQKQKILGKKGYDAYAAGEVELQDFVRVVDDPVFGRTRVLNSVDAAKAQYTARTSPPPPAAPVTTASGFVPKYPGQKELPDPSGYIPATPATPLTPNVAGWDSLLTETDAADYAASGVFPEQTFYFYPNDPTSVQNDGAKTGNKGYGDGIYLTSTPNPNMKGPGVNSANTQMEMVVNVINPFVVHDASIYPVGTDLVNKAKNFNCDSLIIKNADPLGDIVIVFNKTQTAAVKRDDPNTPVNISGKYQNNQLAGWASSLLSPATPTAAPASAAPAAAPKKPKTTKPKAGTSPVKPGQGPLKPQNPDPRAFSKEFDKTRGDFLRGDAEGGFNWVARRAGKQAGAYDPAEEITQEERWSIENYTGSGYNTMNTWLRKENRDPNSPTARYFSSVVDDVGNMEKAFDRVRMPQDISVTRNSTVPWGSSWATAKPGAILTDKGFVSTSVKNDWSGFSGSTIPGRRQAYKLVATVPKGARAMYVEPLTVNPREYEVILAPDTQLLVTETEIERDASGNETLVIYANVVG